MELNAIKTRLEHLLTAAGGNRTMAVQSELYHGALSIIEALYGSNNSHERDLRALIEAIGGDDPSAPFRIHKAIPAIHGALNSIHADIDAGLIGSIRATVSGEVLGDLLKLARTVLDEPGDEAKNVASVLAAAAFEDTLRKLADLSALPHQDKLAEVLTALKDAGVLQGAQVGIAQSYLTFRNRALHAKWAEVDRAAAQSVLSFTEQIVALKFT